MTKSKEQQEGSEYYKVDDELEEINALWQLLKKYDWTRVNRILHYLEDRNDNHRNEEYDDEDEED